MADKEPTAEEKREALIKEKMRVTGMTRENAELVIKHQAEADEAVAKRKKKKDEPKA